MARGRKQTANCGARDSFHAYNTTVRYSARLTCPHVARVCEKLRIAMTRRDFLASAVALALRRDRVDSAVALVEKAVADGRVSAAGIDVQQDTYSLSRVFGRAPSPETPFLLASITKPMTATAVMILSDRGALAISDPVRKFIPEFTGADRQSIRSNICSPTLRACRTCSRRTTLFARAMRRLRTSWR